MNINEYIIFGEKKLSGLFEDIYNNSATKKKQINTLISELKHLVKKPQDAALIVPLIREYLDVSVRNDEHLVKLAMVIQRLISSTKRISDDDDIEDVELTDEEKDGIIKDIAKSVLSIGEKDADEINKELDSLMNKTNDIVNIGNDEYDVDINTLISKKKIEEDVSGSKEDNNENKEE